MSLIRAGVLLKLTFRVEFCTEIIVCDHPKAAFGLRDAYHAFFLIVVFSCVKKVASEHRRSFSDVSWNVSVMKSD